MLHLTQLKESSRNVKVCEVLTTQQSTAVRSG